MPETRIHYLTSSEVDRDKWDRCVENSPNSLIYNHSIYLDMMADHWNAIVVGDYKAVMPLPWRKKFFVKYHYHVPFIAQAGLSGEYTDGQLRSIRKLILKHISYGDIFLNHGNASFAKYLRATPLVNLVLDLSVEFPHLHKNYNMDLEKNLRRSTRFAMSYLGEANVKLPIAVFRKLYASRLASVRPLDFERFTLLCLHLQKSDKVLIRKVIDGKGRLMAIALLLKDNKRLYNMMNSVTPEGRRRSANHFLFDQLIREFAGSGLVLDFEGSDKPGIRKFYQNFGAANEPYFWFRRFPVPF